MGKIPFHPPKVQSQIPSNVWLHFRDRFSCPVDTAYHGRNEAGKHLWIVVQDTAAMVREHGALLSMSVDEPIGADTVVIALAELEDDDVGHVG